MNRSKGLVAYGDSDSESSDEDTIMTTAPKQTEPSAALQNTQESETSSDKDPALDRPTPQDTISARSIINARSSGADSLKKIASTNLLKQGLASAENTHVDQSPGVEGSVSNAHSTSDGSFVRSQSGTPLPPDHSAAAEVFNTPTGGRSPQVGQTECVPIAEEIESTRNADILMGSEGDDEGEGGVMSQQSRRAALMRLLLRPKPIPGVENFGIPPSPEGEVNPDVQAKMEQFQHVKVTRGIHFNQSLMRNKNFRNPHIYSSLVEFAALNEIGSNFEKKEFFDFEGYGPESYATGIAEAQKQAAEKLAQQQHAMPRSQLQFVAGSSAQAGMSNIGGGIGLGLAGGVARPQIASLSSSSSTSASSIVQTGATGSQRSRKSKWDIPQTADDPASKRTRH